MRHRATIFIRTAILLAAVIATRARGADVPVSIIDFAFSPAAVTINVNDTVVWTWDGNFHSSTSGNNCPTGDGLWDSGVFNPPHTYSRTFTSLGSFPYFCTVHCFTGTVTVTNASVPPTVTITNPPAGSTLSAPAKINLQATASDSGGTVTGVGFYQGSTLLGSVASSPYSFVVSNLAAGPYTFSAVATNNTGLTATNSVSIQVVTPVAILLSAAQWTSPGSFQFDYTANPGLKYMVRRSLALPDWIPIGTNTAASASVLFTDTNASATAGFYQVQLLPNP